MSAPGATGEEIDLETYGQLTDRLGRTFGRLGLKRVARDVKTLDQYLADTYGEQAPEAATDATEADLATAPETAIPGLPTAAESPSSTGGLS